MMRMTKHDGRLVVVFAAAAIAAGLSAAEDNFEAADADGADTNSTVITSTRLTYDQGKKTAVFEENVLVVDPRARITADKLTVIFDEKNNVTAIEAEGSVNIREGDRVAGGDKVRYETAGGSFIVSGGARLQHGRDTLSADVIRFWRDSSRVQCERQSRLVIRTERDFIKTGPGSKQDVRN